MRSPATVTLTPERSGDTLLYGWPVLLVVHDAAGTWHLMASHPSEPHHPGSAGASEPAVWAQLVAADATLHDLDGLPPGWIAAREHPQQPWRRQPG